MKKSLLIKNGLKQVRHGFKRPFMMMFETTLHCNMKCVYCSVWSDDRNEPIAKPEKIFRRIDEAVELGIFVLSFSGGEPLMNQHTGDYIEYASKKGLFTSMPTNGLALKKFAHQLQYLDQLEVSIDTLDREKFDKRRGLDSLNQILDGLEYLKKTSPPKVIQINAAVDVDNLGDLPLLAQFCDDNGYLLHTEAVHTVMRYGLSPDYPEVQKNQIGMVTDYLKALRKKHKSVRFYTHYYEFFQQDGFNEKFPCRSASHLINMKPDGSVHFPCAFVTLHRADAPLKEIYESEPVQKLIREEKTMWDFCNGCKIGCPYEVSAYINNPKTMFGGVMDFLQWR